jgi:hypothetical protein
MTHHFHVETSARDCDGGHASEGPVFAYAGQTGRWAWDAYIAHVLRFHGLFGTQPDQQIERWTDPEGFWHIEFGGPTDEGFWFTHTYTCADDCEQDSGSVWDEYAEAAGY